MEDELIIRKKNKRPVVDNDDIPINKGQGFRREYSTSDLDENFPPNISSASRIICKNSNHASGVQFVANRTFSIVHTDDINRAVKSRKRGPNVDKLYGRTPLAPIVSSNNPPNLQVQSDNGSISNQSLVLQQTVGNGSSQYGGTKTPTVKSRKRGPNVDKLYGRTPLAPIVSSNNPPNLQVHSDNGSISNQSLVLQQTVENGSSQIGGTKTPIVKSRKRGPNVDKLHYCTSFTPIDLNNINARNQSSIPGSSNSKMSANSRITFQLPTSQISKKRNIQKETSGPEKHNLIESFEAAADGCEHHHQTSNDEQYIFQDSEDEDEVHNPVVYDPNLWKGYMDIGAPDKLCAGCGAQMWNEERNNKMSKSQAPTFSLCCKNGNIKLPKEPMPPEPLASLLAGGPKSKHFKQHIRMYNCMFAFTSSGGKVDNSINRGRCPYIFKLQGQNYHMVGSLVPPDRSNPKFCQLYIYDTENEVENRIKALGGTSDDIDPEIVESLLAMLDQNNKLVESFRMARDRFENNDLDEFKLVLISSQSSSGRKNHVTQSDEVAAFIVSDDADTSGIRDTIVHSKINGLQRIFETDPYFMQLQYPLLFPLGNEGFHLHIPLQNPNKSKKGTEHDDVDSCEPKHRETVSHKEYYSYKIMIRVSEGLTLHLAGRLWQQYIVDAFTAMEQYRLDWVSTHQNTIRADLYHSVRDALRKGDNDPTHVGKAVILPASFTGSQRYMQQYFKDSLAICRAIGHPSLFLTMTCNTKWPEIKSMLSLLPNVHVADAPDVVARVFKLKLDQLIDLIKKKNYFGRCIGVMHVIEFQKRGLPHVHMLIWLHPDDRPNTTEKIDKLVTAEIPNEVNDPVGYNAVKNYMMHGPCGKDNGSSPCMVNKKCIRHFPKRYNAHTFFDESGFPVYRRRRTDNVILKKGVVLDNQFVVPYNRDLLIRFQCHINLEVCNSSRSLKYLFKYCLKGHDTATMMMRKKNKKSQPDTTNVKEKSLDEVKNYLDGRYVCASEAAWRIFGFDIHSRWPSVDRLPIHLPGEKSINFKKNEDLAKVVQKANNRKTKLEAWFIANSEIPQARNFTYADFPSQFTWHPKLERWKLRQRGDVVGRLTEVHTNSGELLYLRMLLLRRKGALSFKDLRTIDGKVYETFKEACGALGLLKNDNQWHDALKENSHSAMPAQLRSMFVNILVYGSVSDPFSLWEANWKILSDDIEFNRRRLTENNELSLSESDIKNYALAEIEKLFNDVGKSLKDFPMIPFPAEQFFGTSVNRLILEEKGYDQSQMKALHDENFNRLNKEQRETYDAIIDNVHQKTGGMFFVHGSGGCGKTFLWHTLCCRLRSEGKIVLPVASSGIAATLLPGGRTAHSRFHIPLNLDQYSIAGIKHGSDIAELVQQTSLIIWDEAPMQHRHGFEAVDRSLRDIMAAIDPKNSKKSFGGITVVFGGDYRQILPVLPKGNRADTVCASLNKSRLWSFCNIHLLKKNMRLHSGNSEERNKIIAEFSKWQLSIGDGTIGQRNNDNENADKVVTIPDRFIVNNSSTPVQSLIDVVYPDFTRKIADKDYLRSRAILTPTNSVVDDINSQILEKVPGDLHTYLSQDSINDNELQDNEFNASIPVEYLNSINMSGLPKHELKLKVGTVVMLMRNLNQIMGLCNGTRMIVTSCKKNSIECQILCGSQVGTKHLIPRIDMVPSDTKFPYDFKRTQFPLQLCFAMTINKSQGQSLDTVGLYLPRPVFTHGQLYVAISRVTSPEGLYIMIDDDTGGSCNYTSNVVFEEVFYNIPGVD